ncbi:MAG: iron-containing alcohol dehydrogenase [Silicimonas sp.]|nr:iron-containing alcohol dehydrogenase [Silicimonas sp.]
MTLIHLLNRVHFADGVLEDALHSELEVNDKTRPLVVAGAEDSESLEAERFFSGFPRRASRVMFSDIPHLPSAAAAAAVAELYRAEGCDVLVAYGPNRAINLAKAARVAIAHSEALEVLSVDEGGARRIASDLPDLYAVPDVLGFAAAVSESTPVALSDGRQVLLAARALAPTITICDPTLTLGAPSEASVFAAAGVLARAVDSYLSPRYHPPADGLALDALSRIPANIKPALDNDSLSARREIMAAGLNSSFALQKGRSVVQALANAVASVSEAQPEPSAVAGILMSHLVEFYEGGMNGRCARVKHVLGIAPGDSLAGGMRALTESWPIPRRLGDLGVEVSALSRAAELAAKDHAISNGPRKPGAQEIRQVLQAAH